MKYSQGKIEKLLLEAVYIIVFTYNFLPIRANL